ncbi:MAG: hypothetical protein HKN70_14980 [Gammaproteobacteria bacterium]|nr:hypothetical protein [Gammaproteobacteria bacterium]
MNSLFKTGLLLLIILTTGCATSSLGPYESFAASGQDYAVSLHQLLDVAQKTAIDKSSAELIDRNSFANRNDANFNTQQIAQLERQQAIDQARIAVFNDIRKHLLALSNYFTQLNALATSDEAGATSTAIEATVKRLGELTARLRDQQAFALDDDQKNRISRVSDYAIGSRQRAALKKRIQADEKILQEALNTHEVLLEAIGDDLEHEVGILNERLYQWRIEGPFTAATPLLDRPDVAQEWMDERRRLINSVPAIGELRAAGRAAASLRRALQKLVSDEADFLTQLNQLKVELEAIRNVIAAF